MDKGVMTQNTGNQLWTGSLYSVSTVQGGRRPEAHELNLTLDGLHRALEDADEIRDSWLKNPPETLMPSLRKYHMKPSIRTLNLNVFPTERNALVSTAFKNYALIYAKTVMRMPQYLAQFDDGAGFRVLIQYLLHDDLLVTATVAFSQCMHDLISSGPGSVSKSTLQYYGTAMKMLRCRLDTQQYHTSDAVLLTIYQLLSVEAFASADDESARHVGALQAIIELRGGLAKLGFWGLLKGFAACWISYRNIKDRLLLDDRIQSIQSAAPTYMRVPLERRLCARLMPCPLGVVEMAMAGCLSVEVLTLVERFVALTAYRKTAGYSKNLRSVLKEFDELVITLELSLKNTALSQQERLLVIGLLALCCFWRDVGTEISRCYLHAYCAHLSWQDMRGFGLLPQSRQRMIRQDALQLWAGVVLYATTEPATEALALSQMLLPQRIADADLFEIRRLFFWDDVLSERCTTRLEKIVELPWGQRVVEQSDKRDSRRVFDIGGDDQLLV